jgi:hypothetical protein
MAKADVDFNLRERTPTIMLSVDSVYLGSETIASETQVS